MATIIPTDDPIPATNISFTRLSSTLTGERSNIRFSSFSTAQLGNIGQSNWLSSFTGKRLPDPTIKLSVTKVSSNVSFSTVDTTFALNTNFNFNETWTSNLAVKDLSVQIIANPFNTTLNSLTYDENKPTYPLVSNKPNTEDIVTNAIIIPKVNYTKRNGFQKVQLFDPINVTSSHVTKFVKFQAASQKTNNVRHTHHHGRHTHTAAHYHKHYHTNHRHGGLFYHQHGPWYNGETLGGYHHSPNMGIGGHESQGSVTGVDSGYGTYRAASHGTHHTNYKSSHSTLLRDLTYTIVSNNASTVIPNPLTFFSISTPSWQALNTNKCTGTTSTTTISATSATSDKAADNATTVACDFRHTARITLPWNATNLTSTLDSQITDVNVKTV